jgi:uncharacterized protein (TIGR01777 family)
VRVGVTGATGFVGRAVVDALQRRGDTVVAFSRNPESAHLPAGVEAVKFDVNDASSNPRALDGLDAVVHLAGETVNGRWTPAKKRRIFDSRVGGTRNLVSALASLDRKPSVIVSASAIGYYGNHGDEVLDDDSPPGHDFLAGVCVAWEREAQAAVKLGIRSVSIRISMVLGSGGALAKLVPIFRFGAGGPLGSGRQWMPWIHIDDLVSLFCLAIDRDALSGAIVGASPDYATNARVMQALGHALGRPALATAPGFALKLVLGEFAETLLGGQLILPAKAMAAGFAWRHLQLEAAMIAVVAPNSGRTPAVQTFEHEQLVKAPMESVFGFFGRAENLEKLTPPALRLKMASTGTGEMRRGSTIEYSLRVHGLRIRWRALIVEWSPNVRFVDVQTRGPYLWWRHTHEFEERDGGVAVRDRVDFILPLAPLGNIALPAVRNDIESAFAYRRRAIEDIFAA